MTNFTDVVQARPIISQFLMYWNRPFLAIVDKMHIICNGIYVEDPYTYL